MMPLDQRPQAGVIALAVSLKESLVGDRWLWLGHAGGMGLSELSAPQGVGTVPIPATTNEWKGQRRPLRPRCDRR